jgi:hypothetical protein
MAVSDDAIGDRARPWAGHCQQAVGAPNPSDGVGRLAGRAVAYDTASLRPRDPTAPEGRGLHEGLAALAVLLRGDLAPREALVEHIGRVALKPGSIESSCGKPG